MWHKFVLTVRFLWYLVLGCLVCLVLTFIFNDWSLFPQKFYHFQWYHLYLGGTLLCLPIFCLRHPQLFSTDDDFVSYRQKALDHYHQDKASHYRGGRWTTSNVHTDPFEYTSNYTQSYDSSIGVSYSFAKSLFMSAIFLLFAPLFYLGLYLRTHKKSG